ncbi:MAG: hypothetical protein AAF526_11200 [Pseudomonadota bacterium]
MSKTGEIVEVEPFPTRWACPTLRAASSAASSANARALAFGLQLVGGSSFAAGKTVTTIVGPVPIEAIRKGNLVLARHETTGELAYAEVTTLMDGSSGAPGTFAELIQDNLATLR